MARGKFNIPDFVPEGTAVPSTADPSSTYLSPVDNNQTFTASTTPSDQGASVPNAQTGNSTPY